MHWNIRGVVTFIFSGVLVGTPVVGMRLPSKSQTPAQVSAAAGWPVVGGDLRNTRHSPLKQITTQNIKQLGGAWKSQNFQDGASSQSAPVVKDGRMFITAGSRVYALNSKTGETLWTYRSVAKEPPGSIVAVLNTATAFPNTQGVAVGEGLVFAGLMDGRVAALSEKTGEVVWTAQTGDDPPPRGQAVSGAPTYANGVVFAGMANGDWALRGKVVAFEAKTGKKLWEFFAVPGPGEFGHETWPKENDVWKRGGAGVWHTGAVDPELNMVYFDTGNAVPIFGGELREGDNLFTSSVLALDMKTGKLRWHYQVLRHETWEADVSAPLILYDAQIGGSTRKAIGAMRADGYLFLLDRETGKSLIPLEDRPVKGDPRMKSAPTQPYPVGAQPVLPDCNEWKKDKLPAGYELECFWTSVYYDRDNVLMPSPGMKGTPPMAYSPQTGYFYASGRASLQSRGRTDDPYFHRSGARVPGLRSYSILAAIDGRTSKIAWKKEFPIGRPAGPLTTAGGLVFTGQADGNFQAYDAKTGDLLWQFQTGRGGGMGPATSYEVDGEQYVAVPAGPALWTFKIGGTLPQSPAPKLPEPEGDFSGPITNTNEIETVSLNLAGVLTSGQRYYINEYELNPYRARVKVGTRVTWVNNGKQSHTITALDGSWTTGPLAPSQAGYLKFDKPGNHTYICTEHPWTYGQLIVVP